MTTDKTNKPEDQQEEETSPTRDPSDELAGAIDWDKDKNKAKPAADAPLQLAMAGDEQRRPSPFAPRPGDPKPEVPKPEAAKPTDTTKPNDAAAKPVDKVGDPEFLKNLPAGVLDSTQRAYRALQTVVPGQPLTTDQKKAFDTALSDASKLDPKFMLEQQQKIIDDVQSKNRVLPNGAVLPPWTLEKEKQFVEKLQSSQKAFNEMSPEAQQKVGDMQENINRLPANDTIRRGVFQRLLDEEGKKDPKVKAYLDQQSQLDTFTKTNADGLVRRSMHQQELSVLHSKSIVSGIYAIALDRAGQPGDQKQLETLLKDSVSDRFAPANIPELIGLVEKYKLEEKETKELEEKVPGRADLRKALEIMDDPKAGTAAERLEKAKPFFIKAIGAGDLIDQKKNAEEIEKVSKERNELGDKATPEKMAELETKAIELVEKAKLPYEARVKFAIALQNAGVETKDQKLNDQAVAMLRAAESIDPANKFDPIIQGALLLAQKKPPESFDLKKAEEVGKPEVERIKKEMIAKGQIPDDTPMWLKALKFAGETLVGVAAFHLLGKYVFGPIGTAKNHLRRAWEASSRAKSVEVESTPSLKPGEAPVLMFKNKDGKEMPVEGVRKADGKLRVWNGESTELVKPGKGDSLYFKVAPDANLSKDQVRELARQKLNPTGDEQVINEERSRFQEELKIRDRENAELKKANEDLQRRVGEPKGNPANYENLIKEGFLTKETAQKLADLPASSRQLIEEQINKIVESVKAANLADAKLKQATDTVSKSTTRVVDAANAGLSKYAADYPDLFKSLSKSAYDGFLTDSSKRVLDGLDHRTLALYNERLAQGYLNESRLQMLLVQKPETRSFLNDYIQRGSSALKPEALDSLLSVQDRSSDLLKVRDLEEKVAAGEASAIKELSDARKRLSMPLEKLIGLKVGNETIDSVEQGRRIQVFNRYVDLLNKGEIDTRALRRLSGIEWGARHTYEARLTDGFLKGTDLQKIAMTEPSLRKMIDANLAVTDGPLSKKALDQVLSLVPTTEKQLGEKFHEFWERRGKAEAAAAAVQEGLAKSGNSFEATLKALNDGVIDGKDLAKLAVYNKESKQVEYDSGLLLKVLKNADRFDAETADLYKARLSSGFMDGSSLYKISALDASSRAEINKLISGEKPALSGPALKTLLDLPAEGVKSLGPGTERFNKIAEGLTTGKLDRVSLEMLSKMPESQRKIAETIVADALAGKALPKPVNEMLWDKITPDLNTDSRVDANGWNKPDSNRSGEKNTVADLLHGDAELKAVLEKTPTGRELIKRMGNVTTSDKPGLNTEGKLPVALPKDFAGIKDPVQRANVLVQAMAKAEAENAKPSYKYGTADWKHSHVPSPVERDLYQLMRERAFIDELGLPKGAELEKMDREWQVRFYQAEAKQVEGSQAYSVEFDAKSSDPKAMAEYLQRMDDKTKRKFADLFEHLEKKKGPLVVDFGAGSGGVSAELAKMGIRAVPLDLSPEMVNVLRARSREEGLNFYVLNKDSVRFFMGPNSFDATFGSSELHEVGSYGNVGNGRYDLDSIREAISQRVNSLKEGGVIVIRDFVRPDDGRPLTIDLETSKAKHLFKDFYDKWQESREKGNPNKTNLDPKFIVDGKEVDYKQFQESTKPGSKAKASVVMEPAAAMEFMISVKHPGTDAPNYKQQMQGVVDEQFANLTKEQFEKAVKESAPPGYKMEITESKSSTSDEYKEFWNDNFKVRNADGQLVEEKDMPKVKLSLVAVKVPEGASTLGELQEGRPSGGTPTFVPTSLEKLNVSKAMLSEDTVNRFHETVDKLSATLKASPEDAGMRLREAVFEFLTTEGIKDSLLDKERMEFVVSKESTSPSVEFSIGSGEDRKPVVRNEGKFYLADGKTEVPAERVNTKMVIPEGMIRGNVGELSRAVYTTLLDQTNRGTQAAAKQDRAGIHDFVTKTIGKHVPLSDTVGTVTTGGSGLDQSKLPAPDTTKVADLEISERGIKLGGVERDLSFVDVWSDRVKDLEAKLKAEEQKNDKEKDNKKIGELKVAIAQERAFLERLSNPAHPDHKKTTDRALELVRGFKATEGDIDRLAAERGMGGQARGRLVALTILVSAFIGWREKQAAAQSN